MTGIPLTPDSLRPRLLAALDSEGAAWLRQAEAEVRADPTAIRRHFPAVSRSLGRGPLDDPDAGADDPFVVTIDDAGRAALVAGLPTPARVAELPELYRHGDPRERRGVLRSLDVMATADLTAPTLAGVARSLVDDALRTNDTRLVAAALGPAGVDLLGDEAFAQAVLKCVFVGVPLAGIAGLAERTTPELSRMMADFVHERIAAGRDVPGSVWPVIDAHPPAAQLAAIEAEIGHAVPRRAAAARAALAKRA